MRQAYLIAALATGAMLSLSAPLARANSLEVSPTTVELPSQGGKGVLYVVNRGQKPIVAQVEAFDWTQSADQNRLEPSTILAVSPPMVRLAPGQTQIVRLRPRADSSVTPERAFRVVVSELPDPADKTARGVQMLLQFSVPVFVGDRASPPDLVWDAVQTPDGLAVRAHNNGTKRAKLANLHLTSASGQDIPVAHDALNYVLAGTSWEWKLSGMTVEVGQPLRIEGLDQRDGRKIDTSVVVRR